MKSFKLLSVVFLLSMLAFTSSCTRVTPKEEGFKISNSGDYRGVDSLPLLTGVNWYFPGFSQVVTMSTVMQHEVWSESGTEGSEENSHITINCQGGSGFKVDVGLNYRIKPGKGSKIYLKYKSDDLGTITNTYLRNIVRGSMQDISGHITVDSILNDLPGYENAVRKSLITRFDNEGFIMEGFNILAMPKPVDPLLAEAINKKIIAKQDAGTAVMQLQISVANANKKVADAKGDSTSKVVNAGGDARAYELQQRNLTDNILKKMWIDAWKSGGALVPTTILAPGQQYIYNPK